MYSIIRAWGNSQGLYIPKKMLGEVGLKTNDPVQISVVENGLLIKKDRRGEAKMSAFESLKRIRKDHRQSSSAISDDYRKEMEDYLDEKYGK